MASVLSRPYFHDEAAAYAKLESIVWPNGPVCVHCDGTERIGKLKGTATRVGVHKCYSCRKQFRVTVNTVFESSHVKLHEWLQAAYLIASSKKGISSNQMARTLGCTLKTGWFVTHRLREAMAVREAAPQMGGPGGIVEIDETSYGRKAGVPVRRGYIVMEETARGLFTLQTRAERPRHFTNEVMRKTRRVMERVTNGLGSAAIDFGPNLPATRISPTVARAATRNVDLVLESPDKPYKEVGSIEGCLQAVGRDGFGRRIATVVERVTGQPVKCIVRGGALTELEAREIRDIWRSQRVQVAGMIHFEGLVKIDRIDVGHVRSMRPRSELPQIDDILDPDFTGGIESVEYVRRMRDGTLPPAQ